MTHNQSNPIQRPVPPSLVRWGGIAWRVAAIGFVVFYTFQAAKTFRVVWIAAALALLAGSVLWSPVRWLTQRGWPPAAAAMSVLVLAGAVLSGIVFLTVPPIVSSVGDLETDVASAVDSGREWLTDGPVGLEVEQVERFQASVTESLTGGGSLVGSATVAMEAVTGGLLAVIFTFFVLKDGRAMAEMLEERVPDRHSQDVAGSLRTVRQTLAQYMGGMAVVGLFDATAVGIGLGVVGVPLVLPLSMLVFVGAFFPLIGAFVSSLLAVAVAFANGGMIDALIVLGIAVIVQQFEGDVIMPIVFGRALQLHPAVILIGVTAGGLGFGIVGAFIAVPLIATVVALREQLGVEPEQSFVTILRGPG